MDRNQIDVRTKLLTTTGSRRATLGALLGVSLFGRDPVVFARRRKGNGQAEDDIGTSKGNDNARSGQGVRGEGRPGAARKSHHQHKQTRRQRRTKRERKDHHGGQNAKPSSEVCCGATEQCASPEPGSTRSQCNFSGQSFAGQDLHGADFRQIEGAGANFDETDNHGSDFAAACLRFATFRGANLASTSWDGACVFAADFTDADLGGDLEALEAAVLCATIMPDGTPSDRDCDRSSRYPCCLPPPGGGGGSGGEECGPCTASDQCHVAGTCTCTCTTPSAPNGTSCTDGNPLCLAGVCCADGHKAIHGGCFKIGGSLGEGCSRDRCDGFIRDCAPFADDCSLNVCVTSTSTQCNEHADCPVGQACNRGTLPSQCYDPC